MSITDISLLSCQDNPPLHKPSDTLATALLATAAGHPLPVADIALITAVGVLATTQRAPLFAATFGYELTHPPLALAPVLLVTALGARTVAVHVLRLWPQAAPIIDHN